MWPSRPSSQPFISLARIARQNIEQPKTTRDISSSLIALPTRSEKYQSRSISWQCRRWQRHFSQRASSKVNNRNTDSTSEGGFPASPQDPHKEYFQTPGQAPKPDLTPYVRSLPVSSSTSFVPPPPAYLQHHPGSHRPAAQDSFQKSYFQNGSSAPPKRDRFLRRFLRSSLYILIFFHAGVVVGTGVITWEYLSPMFEEGSEEEAETLEAIEDTMDDHALVYELREDGWREIDLSAPNAVSAGQSGRSPTGDLTSTIGSRMRMTTSQFDGDGGISQVRAEGAGASRSMLYRMLTGSKGLVGMRMFHHPSQDYSIMVFFAGFGIEGWPDVVHGGMVTTLLEEAVQLHLDWFHRGQFEQILNVGVKVDFKKPVQPGEVYAVLVPPALVEPATDHGNLGFTSGSVRSGINNLKMVGLFMQLDGAPKVGSGITEHGGASVQHHIEVPGRGRNGPEIHAVGEITLKVAAGWKNSMQQQGLLDSIARNNAAFTGNKVESGDSGQE